MIHVNSIAHAAYTMLSSDSTLVSSDFKVDLDQVFNTDPNRTPWVGVYTDEIDFQPMRVAPGGKPWDAHVAVEIYVQEISLGGSYNANDLLNRAMFPVLSAVNSNLTLGGTVLVIESIDVAPFQRNILEEDNIFTNVITLNTVVRA